MKQRKNNPNIKWIIIAVIVALSLMCVLDPPFWLWSIADSVLDHTLSGDNWYKEQIQKDIDAGKNLNFPLGRNQYTHLHEAALGDYIESAKLLIGKGVDVERRAGCKETPLHRAAQGGSLRVAKLLIENGANIEAEDKSRDTPLFWAISAEENQKEILDLLYENGAKIDIRNEYNSAPITWAGFLGNTIAVKWLIDKKVDADVCDKHNYTALHKAASYGHYKAVSILLENGADVNIVSESNETPLDRALRPREWKYASPWGKRKAARIIRKYGGKKAEELKAERE